MYFSYPHAYQILKQHAPVFLKGFAFTLAPETGKNPGSIYISHAGKYVGKIDPNGKYDRKVPAVLETLTAIGKVPNYIQAHTDKRVYSEIATAIATTYDRIACVVLPVKRFVYLKHSLTSEGFATAVVLEGKTAGRITRGGAYQCSISDPQILGELDKFEADPAGYIELHAKSEVPKYDPHAPASAEVRQRYIDSLPPEVAARFANHKN